jgi:mRNA interferase RelE/StbE
MLIKDTKDFRKELIKLPQFVQKQAIGALETVINASTFSDIPNLKKIAGHDNYYRLRIGQFRIGLYWTGEEFIIMTIGSRGDFYKTFP